jgi:hypothetical protein
VSEYFTYSDRKKNKFSLFDLNCVKFLMWNFIFIQHTLENCEDGKFIERTWIGVENEKLM